MSGNSPVEDLFSNLSQEKRLQAKAFLSVSPRLNTRQKSILHYFLKDDNSIYLQGMAGVGKTELLIRAVFLSDLLRAPGGELLVLAPSTTSTVNLQSRFKKFTNKIERQFSFQPETVRVHSFYSFCLQLLTYNYRREMLLKQFDTSFNENFYLLSGSESRDLWRLVCEKSAAGLKKEDAEYYYREAGKYRRKLMLPSESLEQSATGKEKKVVAFYREYWRIKRERNALDYEDILFITIDLFRQKTHLRKQLLKDYSIVFVDDFQSLTPLQFYLLTQFDSAGKRILAAGDPLTIRGDEDSVDFNGREQFRLYFPNSSVVTLTKNYRLKTLLWAALMDVLESFDESEREEYPELKPARLAGKSGLAFGEGPALFEAINADEEQKFITHRIKKYLDNAISPGDIAVVTRLKNRQMAIKQQLARASCPSVIMRRANFWSAEVPRIVDAVIRLAEALNQTGNVNSSSPDFYILRLLRIFHPSEVSTGLRNFAKAGRLLDEIFRAGRYPVESASVKQFLHKLREFILFLANSQETISLLDLLQVIKKEFNLVQDKSLLRQAREMRRRLETLPGVSDVVSFTALKELLIKIRCQAAVQGRNKSEDAVVIATPRLLSGREFDVVIISMLEEGTWPLYSGGSRLDEDVLKIEKRLFYLAYSRARDEVILTFAWRRKIQERWEWRQPSQFLDCLAGEYVDKRHVNLSWLSRLHRYFSKTSKIPV